MSIDQRWRAKQRFIVRARLITGLDATLKHRLHRFNQMDAN